MPFLLNLATLSTWALLVARKNALSLSEPGGRYGASSSLRISKTEGFTGRYCPFSSKSSSSPSSLPYTEPLNSTLARSISKSAWLFGFVVSLRVPFDSIEGEPTRVYSLLAKISLSSSISCISYRMAWARDECLSCMFISIFNRSLISLTCILLKSNRLAEGRFFSLFPLLKHVYSAIVYLPGRLTMGVAPNLPD